MTSEQLREPIENGGERRPWWRPARNPVDIADMLVRTRWALAEMRERRRRQVIQAAVDVVLEADTWEALRVMPSYAPLPAIQIREATPEI